MSPAEFPLEMKPFHKPICLFPEDRKSRNARAVACVLPSDMSRRALSPTSFRRASERALKRGSAQSAGGEWAKWRRRCNERGEKRVKGSSAHLCGWPAGWPPALRHQRALHTVCRYPRIHEGRERLWHTNRGPPFLLLTVLTVRWRAAGQCRQKGPLQFSKAK